MKTHGMRKHPLYRTWADMHYRCEKRYKPQFKYYGGRGISVCERWSDFATFVADMGERPWGSTLDRIDPNGNYEPANCRWSAKVMQANNTTANRYFEIEGERMTLSQASRKWGVPPGTIARRIKLGWAERDAIKTPVRKHKKYERQTMSATMRAEGKAYS